MSREYVNPFASGERRNVQTIIDELERGAVLRFPSEFLMPLLVAASKVKSEQRWSIEVADGMATVFDEQPAPASAKDGE